MSPAARRFWWRYRLLTGLLPLYALAALSYGCGAVLALAFREQGYGAADWNGALRWLALPVLLCLLPVLHALAVRLGLLASGIRTQAALHDAAQQARLTALQVQTALPLLRPILLQLPAPYLAVRGRQLLLSTAMAQLPDEQLTALLAHEQAHAHLSAQRPLHALLGYPALYWSWLLALPLCWLATPWPLLLPLLAALHVSLWLRWQAAASARREAAADLLAMQALGRERYLSVLLPHLALFEQPGSTALRRSRLRRMGLDDDAIAQWLRRP
jgi:hypothetical protein